MGCWRWDRVQRDPDRLAQSLDTSVDHLDQLTLPIADQQLIPHSAPFGEFGPEERDPFFRQVMSTMSDSGIPYLVGGAYALERYTGIVRRTKDLDIFVRARDCSATLMRLAQAGYATELTDRRWIAKAFMGDHH